MMKNLDFRGIGLLLLIVFIIIQMFACENKPYTREYGYEDDYDVEESLEEQPSEDYSYDEDEESYKTILWDQADPYIGETVAVVGPVANVHYGDEQLPTFINIGNDYPDPHRFQAIVWNDDIDKFPYDLKELIGKDIMIVGEIQKYDYFSDGYSVAEIVITDPKNLSLYDWD